MQHQTKNNNHFKTKKIMRTIKATPNHSQRTFTLRVYFHGILATKYRTVKLPKEEFDSCLYNTSNDWLQFLKSDEYYLIHIYK